MYCSILNIFETIVCSWNNEKYDKLTCKYYTANYNEYKVASEMLVKGYWCHVYELLINGAPDAGDIMSSLQSRLFLVFLRDLIKNKLCFVFLS